MAQLGQSTALGTIVEVDFDGDDPGATPTYTPIGLLKGNTPPGRTGNEADANTLGDALETFANGIESDPAFVFSQFFYPGDAEQAKIDTAFDNRRKPAGVGGGVVTVRILYPHDGVEVGDDMPTQAFLVNITGIGVDEVAGPDDMYMRTITCRRLTDIVVGTFTVV